MWFLGLIIAVGTILYKRATEIVVVRPLDGLKRDAGTPDFASILTTIQQAAEQAAQEANRQNQPRRERQIAAQVKGKSEQGRAAIRALVANNRFYEAIDLYRRIYGVDQEAAKKAVDEMMLQ